MENLQWDLEEWDWEVDFQLGFILPSLDVMPKKVTR
jgi:hypothetical protein